MDTASQFIIARKDAEILKAAFELCDMYENRFSSAGMRQTNSSYAYSFGKTAQAFMSAKRELHAALITARHHGEQDALDDY